MTSNSDISVSDSVYRRLLELPEEERSAYLDLICGDDKALRSMFEDRLAAEPPPPAVVPGAPRGAFMDAKLEGYRVVRRIAVGGMGMVYEAIDEGLEIQVALKIVHPVFSHDERLMRRFKAEARALARVRNPYIVTIHALREQNNQTFIVMEYVEGITLSDHLKASGPLPWKTCAKLFGQLLGGLADVHERGIIHRDVKPNNIMLLDGQERVKLLDFGLARDSGEAATVFTSMASAGTPNYMSPEQITAGYDIDWRTDLFSVAMTMYQMLSGRLPYVDAETPFTIQKAIADGNFVPIREACDAEMPDALVHLLEKALAVDPDDRYQSAEEMQQALAAIESGASITSEPAIVSTEPAPKADPEPLAEVAAPPERVEITTQEPPSDGKSKLPWFLAGAIALALALTMGWSLLRTAPGNITSSTAPAERVDVEPPPEEPVGPVEDAISPPAALEIIPSDSAETDQGDFSAADSLMEASNTEPAEDLVAPVEEVAPVEDIVAPVEEVAPSEEPAAMAVVSVLVAPEGTLFIDGQSRGTISGRQRIEILPGLHRFEIRNDAMKRSWTRRFNARLDRVLPITVDFNFMHDVFVTAFSEAGEPVPGVEIVLNGARTGLFAPRRLQIPFGVNSLGARKSGMSLKQVRFSDSDGRDYVQNPTPNFDTPGSSYRVQLVVDQ